MQWKKQAALVLAVCVLAQAVPFWALAEGEPLPGEEGQVCLCQALCTQEEQNGDCPVCGVPGADLSLCQGQPAEQAERICRQVEEGSHPDLRVVTSGERSSISVDEVRAIIEDIYLRPNEGEKKIILIGGAGEMLSLIHIFNPLPEGEEE